ncbi:ATP-dependent Clp protease adaptor ClpS [Gracilimonas tropica]|uniref:ATP-dependent Clp protease adaptor ClpS n=1 Tax=Gracilimonas tropica TaxID=454600 RepID=UPI00037FB744|nr:ATP-dependent Clp protease adaptor ClpS [Gracilimonas tropica]
MRSLSQHIDVLELSEADTEEITKEKTKEEVQDSVNTPWRLILYDDDIHTFEEVISQLMKATGCSLSKAEDMTWKVHNEGKATVHEGEFEECLRIDSVLKEIQLVTEIKG